MGGTIFKREAHSTETKHEIEDGSLWASECVRACVGVDDGDRSADGNGGFPVEANGRATETNEDGWLARLLRPVAR